MKVQTINYYNNVVPFSSRNSIQKAVNISEKMDKLFHRENDDAYLDFVYGELDEFDEAVKNNDNDNMEEEIGDVLFDTIMLAHHYQIDPQKALNRTNKKINSRINLVKSYAAKPILKYSLDERLEFWDRAKKDLAKKD